ncbi:hypothetical protein Q5752_001276 [Cryptotrichosporon argae]
MPAARSTAHPALQLNVDVADEPCLTGTAVEGRVVLVNNGIEPLKLGVIALELVGVEEARAGTVSHELTRLSTTFQSPGCPLNAVDRASVSREFYPARRGTTTFPFSLALPPSLPSSTTSPAAHITYTLMASVQIAGRELPVLPLRAGADSSPPAEDGSPPEPPFTPPPLALPGGEPTSTMAAVRETQKLVAKCTVDVAERVDALPGRVSDERPGLVGIRMEGSGWALAGGTGQVELSIVNGSAERVSQPRLALVRRIRVRTPTTDNRTEQVWFDRQFAGREHTVRPLSEACLVLPFAVPRGMRTVSPARTSAISVAFALVLTVPAGFGRTGAARLTLPLLVVDPLSVAPDVWLDASARETERKSAQLGDSDGTGRDALDGPSAEQASRPRPVKRWSTPVFGLSGLWAPRKGRAERPTSHVPRRLTAPLAHADEDERVPDGLDPGAGSLAPLIDDRADPGFLPGPDSPAAQPYAQPAWLVHSPPAIPAAPAPAPLAPRQPRPHLAPLALALPPPAPPWTAATASAAFAFPPLSCSPATPTPRPQELADTHVAYSTPVRAYPSASSAGSVGGPPGRRSPSRGESDNARLESRSAARRGEGPDSAGAPTFGDGGSPTPHAEGNDYFGHTVRLAAAPLLDAQVDSTVTPAVPPTPVSPADSTDRPVPRPRRHSKDVRDVFPVPPHAQPAPPSPSSPTQHSPSSGSPTPTHLTVGPILSEPAVHDMAAGGADAEAMRMSPPLMPSRMKHAPVSPSAAHAQHTPAWTLTAARPVTAVGSGMYAVQMARPISATQTRASSPSAPIASSVAASTAGLMRPLARAQTTADVSQAAEARKAVSHRGGVQLRPVSLASRPIDDTAKSTADKELCELRELQEKAQSRVRAWLAEKEKTRPLPPAENRRRPLSLFAPITRRLSAEVAPAPPRRPGAVDLWAADRPGARRQSMDAAGVVWPDKARAGLDGPGRRSDGPGRPTSGLVPARGASPSKLTNSPPRASIDGPGLSPVSPSTPHSRVLGRTVSPQSPPRPVDNARASKLTLAALPKSPDTAQTTSTVTGRRASFLSRLTDGAKRERKWSVSGSGQRGGAAGADGARGAKVAPKLKDLVAKYDRQ